MIERARSRGGLDFDVVSLIEHSSPPMLVLCGLLIAASVAVWFTAIVKFRQLARLERAERELRHEILHSNGDIDELLDRHQGSLGGELLGSFARRDHAVELVDSETDYLVTLLQKKVFSGFTLLASVATTAPLAGLFGTVYGIMEAFAWIGAGKDRVARGSSSGHRGRTGDHDSRAVRRHSGRRRLQRTVAQR